MIQSIWLFQNIRLSFNIRRRIVRTFIRGWLIGSDDDDDDDETSVNCGSIWNAINRYAVRGTKSGKSRRWDSTITGRRRDSSTRLHCGNSDNEKIIRRVMDVRAVGTIARVAARYHVSRLLACSQTRAICNVPVRQCLGRNSAKYRHRAARPREVVWRWKCDLSPDAAATPVSRRAELDSENRTTTRAMITIAKVAVSHSRE